MLKIRSDKGRGFRCVHCRSLRRAEGLAAVTQRGTGVAGEELLVCLTAQLRNTLPLSLIHRLVQAACCTGGRKLLLIVEMPP